MLVIPAIDLLDGRCVRLEEGRRERATVFADDPAAQAAAFAAQGALRLHVVDLDGAFEGRPKNATSIAAIARAVTIPVQVGGGLRDAAAVDAVLELGARFAILGTVAAREPAALAAICARHPGRVLVAIDARDGRVAVRGWVEATDLDPATLARATEAAGAAGIVYTDIARDGTGRGVNVEATTRLAEAVRIPVVASGGVGTLDDVRRLAARGSIGGVVIGQALYTGQVRLREAIAAATAMETATGTGSGTGTGEGSH